MLRGRARRTNTKNASVLAYTTEPGRIVPAFEDSLASANMDTPAVSILARMKHLPYVPQYMHPDFDRENVFAGHIRALFDRRARVLGEFPTGSQSICRNSLPMV
jgi:hypothetical protein